MYTSFPSYNIKNTLALMSISMSHLANEDLHQGLLKGFYQLSLDVVLEEAYIECSPKSRSALHHSILVNNLLVAGMHFLVFCHQMRHHQAKVHITCNYSLFSKSKVQQPLDTVSMHQVGNGQACTQANKAANTVPVHDMPSRWQKLGMQGVCERLPEPLYQHQQ